MHWPKKNNGQVKMRKDMLTNILATSVCTAVLNLVVYPLFARKFSSEAYGSILTALGIINVLFSGLGNTLNNVRLIKNRTTGESNRDNPYNCLILLSAIVGTVVGTYFVQHVYTLSPITVMLVSLTLFVGIIRAYYLVEFRLRINYIKYLISNIIVTLGYIAGILMIKTFEYWPLPFLFGEVLSLLFVFWKNSLIHEGFFKKKDKDGITKSYALLVGCSLLANILVYLDRFLINPILGAAFVSTYSVAGFWGKCFGPFVAPVATVLLSYLSQEGTKISLRKYQDTFVVTLVFIAIFSLVGVVVAPFLTRLLYPTLIKDAEPYILLVSTGVLIGYATCLIMPMIMTVCSMKDVFFLQSIQFVTYLLFARIGALSDGLLGFCWAVFIVNVIKVLLNFAWGWYRVKNKQIV